MGLLSPSGTLKHLSCSDSRLGEEMFHRLAAPNYQRFTLTGLTEIAQRTKHPELIAYYERLAQCTFHVGSYEELVEQKVLALEDQQLTEPVRRHSPFTAFRLSCAASTPIRTTDGFACFSLIWRRRCWCKCCKPCTISGGLCLQRTRRRNCCLRLPGRRSDRAATNSVGVLPAGIATTGSSGVCRGADSLTYCVTPRVDLPLWRY